MAHLTRRALITAASGLAATGLLTAGALRGLPEVSADPVTAARDNRYWQAIRGLYDISEEMIHLEHGNWGMMARPVLDAYKAAIERVNARTSLYARREFGADLEKIISETAEAIGASPEEIVFTRNATEAMQALISGYNKLRPGEGVLFADLDYPSMQSAMNWLRVRRGANVFTHAIPEPASHQATLDSHRRSLEAHPGIRLVLLTHVSHRTGLVLPVAELTELIRSYGADVLLDSAHALGQVDLDVASLGADFIGFNLHKWIGAPLGVGLAYIRRARIMDIDPFMSAEDPASQAIRARVHTGTVNIAALLAVPEALAMHRATGAARKQARLQYLRNLWTERFRDEPRLEILTPQDERLLAGITSFRLSGRNSREENSALARRLAEEFGIFTVMRDDLASGACVRVTPAVFTNEAEINALSMALEQIMTAPD